MNPGTARTVRLGTYAVVVAALVALGATAVSRLGAHGPADGGRSEALGPGVRIEAPPGIEETLGIEDAIDDTTAAGRLVAAARVGDAGRVRALLDEGVSANARERKNGHGPLHQAARANSPEVVEILLAAGADPSAPDGQGVTPLMRAAESAALEAGRRLLAAGVDVNEQHEPDGNTALTHLIGGLFVRSMTGGEPGDGSDPLGFARLLLAHGADPNPKNRSGDEPLKAVVVMQDAALLELLLEHGARLDQVSDIQVLARMPGPVGDLVTGALQDDSGSPDGTSGVP